MSKRALIAAVSLVIGTLSVASPALAEPSSPPAASPSTSSTPTNPASPTASTSPSASASPSESTTSPEPTSSASSTPSTTPPSPTTPATSVPKPTATPTKPKPSPPTLVQPAATGAGSFAAVTPTRLLDTRTGLGAPTGPIPAYGTVSVQVGGTAGVPSTGVAAALVNITVLSATQSGYLTAWPDGTTRSSLNNLFIYPGHSVSNLTVGRLGGNGKLDLVNRTAGPIQVTVDVSGYYLAGAATTPGSFTPLDPVRFLDTRTGTGVAKGSVPANGVVKLQLAGRGSVPASGVSAVALNLFALSPTQAGGLTVYPDGSARPPSYSPYFPAGRHVGELVIARLGAAGKVDIFNGSAAPLAMAADVVGYYRSGAVTTAGGYQPIAPTRVLDTRSGLGTYQTALAPGGTAQVKLTGTGGVPASGVSAVFVNQYAFTPAGAGALSDFAGNTPQTHVSSGDLTPGVTSSTPSLVQVGSDGTVLVHSTSNQPVQVLLEVQGYLLGDPAPATTGQLLARVTDTTGHPIAGVIVRNTAERTNQVVASVYTDATGHALFTDLPEDQYSMCGYPDPSRTSGGSSAVGYLSNCGTLTTNTTDVGQTDIYPTVQLTAASAVSGKVTDAAGKPIKGVIIDAGGENGAGPSGVTTGADGTYKLTGIYPEYNENICFDARNVRTPMASGYVRQCYNGKNQTFANPLNLSGDPVNLNPGQVTAAINGALIPAAAVAGKVTDPSGKPLAGITIYVNSSSGGQVPTTTDSAGDYEVSGLTAGTYAICFIPQQNSAPSIAQYRNICYGEDYPDFDYPTTLVAGKVTTGVGAQLNTGGTARVVVTDQAGHPLTGADVAPDNYAYGPITGADGSANVTNLAPGVHTLCVSGQGATGGSSPAGYLDRCYGDAAKVTVQAGHTATVTVALPAAAGVHLTVTDADGHPISGVTSFGAGTTDANGNLDQIGLTPGTGFAICVNANGTDGRGTGVDGPSIGGYQSRCYGPYDDPEPTVDLTAGTLTPLHVVLNSLGAITGTISDEHGHRLAHVAISAVDYTTGYGGGGTTSNADGSYLVRRLSPGDYSLCFRDDQSWPDQPVTGGDSTTGYVKTCYPDALNYQPGNRVSVSSGSATTIDGTLRSAAEITGVVTDSTGAPIPSATVSVLDSGPVPNNEAVTDANGRYELDLLTPGDHIVCASYNAPAPDGLAYQSACSGGTTSSGTATPITLTDGQIATDNWTLPEAGGVRGTATTPSGAPRQGLLIEFDNLADGSRYNTYTDKHGQWQLNYLPSGQYSACFEDFSMGITTQCYNAQDGTPAPITVTVGRWTDDIDITWTA